MNKLIELLKNAKSVDCKMSSNIITVDDVEYQLYGAVLHSNWGRFDVHSIERINHYDKPLHGIKFANKENKTQIPVDSYFNIVFLSNDSLRSVTIEYNSEIESNWSNP